MTAAAAAGIEAVEGFERRADHEHGEPAELARLARGGGARAKAIRFGIRQHRERELLGFIRGALELGDHLVDGEHGAQVLRHGLAPAR